MPLSRTHIIAAGIAVCVVIVVIVVIVAMNSGDKFKWYTTGNDISWQNAMDLCEKKDMKLCNLKQVCPGGELVSHEQEFGPDRWVPIGNADNEWVQVADSRMCQTHTQVAGSTPGWGTTNESHGFRGHVACCAN